MREKCADPRSDTIFAAVGAFQPTLSYGCLTPTTERTFAGGSGPRMRSLRAPALARNGGQRSSSPPTERVGFLAEQQDR
jgi:hypothetical protein